MKFQAFHVNPGEKLKKKDVNNDLSHFMSVFPIAHASTTYDVAGQGQGLAPFGITYWWGSMREFMIYLVKCTNGGFTGPPTQSMHP